MKFALVVEVGQINLTNATAVKTLNLGHSWGCCSNTFLARAVVYTLTKLQLLVTDL